MNRLIVCFLLMFSAFSCKAQKNIKQPNVILILTDDLGIGDLGCHGNPWLKTPNIDQFYKEAVRMTDFHVSPLCTPTRSAIISGRYPINNGAWATYKGRDALSPRAQSIASVFKQNGYQTGIFGKWHLGDNYPVRPTDLGFNTAIHHLAGGVGELSDYWGNSYFDDVYYVNNEPKQFEGYCTDVWFDETMKFIENNADKPFFIYLPTNAPHDPLIVDEKYAEPYKHLEGEKIIDANLYGMIANIDENFGKFRKFLKDKKLEDNTILIFMSDNGTRFGYGRPGKFGYKGDKTIGYNMGYDGIKGDKLEGGHIVPFFIKWTNGKIKGGKDIHQLTAHVDLLPTLSSLCNINIPETYELDGKDFSSLLLKDEPLEDRTVLIHHRQDWRPPFDVNQTALMKDKWRLINGKQLYNIENDRMQTKNVAMQHPEIVASLLAENEKFLERTKENPEYYEMPVSVVGTGAQEEIKLTIQHAIGEDGGIWKPEQVSAGIKNKNNTHAIEIEQDGIYEISCRRWPKECPGPILGIPDKNPKNLYSYETISPEKVRISIANQIFEKEIKLEDTEVVFRVNLQKGKTFLMNDFIEGNESYGVYYTYVRKVE